MERLAALWSSACKCWSMKQARCLFITVFCVWCPVWFAFLSVCLPLSLCVCVSLSHSLSFHLLPSLSHAFSELSWHHSEPWKPRLSMWFPPPRVISDYHLHAYPSLLIQCSFHELTTIQYNNLGTSHFLSVPPPHRHHQNIERDKMSDYVYTKSKSLGFHLSLSSEKDIAELPGRTESVEMAFSRVMIDISSHHCTAQVFLTNFRYV